MIDDYAPDPQAVDTIFEGISLVPMQDYALNLFVVLTKYHFPFVNYTFF